MNNKYIELINNFINGKLNITDLNTSSYNYSFYNSAIDILNELNINRLFYNDVTKILSKSKYNDIFIEMMKNIKTELLYKSHCHGLNHNIRVALFALIICVNEDISLEDFIIIIEGAKYHDIGRENDLTDDSHGKRSAMKMDFLKDEYSNEELNLLKTIVTCHSIDDEYFDSVAKKNNIKDIDRCRKMYNILKDSDALDRVRLDDPTIKINLMRTTTAKELIPFAYEMYESYIKY
ncbi:MAG: HD domain-containing protein [Bacilli bacterium]|nr:HD domain-containing protein [Bacilli bacterium]